MLTSAEVQQLIEQRGLDLSQLPSSPVDPLLTSSSSCSDDGQLYGVHGGAGTHEMHQSLVKVDYTATELTLDSGMSTRLQHVLNSARLSSAKLNSSK